MKKHENIALLGLAGMLVGAGSATAAGPGPGGETNHFNHTNYAAYSNLYENHYLYTNGTDAGWHTNLARWSNAPAPRQLRTQNRVIAPASGPRAQPPGPRPNGPLTPADVQTLIQQFQKDREAFLGRQRALEQQISGAAEQDRQRLRDQLKEQMEQWKQQQARLREQLQEQCARMAEQLRDHSRLMERVSNPGTPTGGPGGQNGGGPRGR